MIKNLLVPLRVKYWWFSKLPPLVTICYILSLWYDFNDIQVFKLVFSILFIFFCGFSYGYAINDIFDIEEDRLAGKDNGMSEMHWVFKAGYLLIPSIAGVACLIYLTDNLFAIYVHIGNYILVTLYSMPPFRLKKRGMLGVLADGFGAHLMPAFCVILICLSEQPLQKITLVLSGIILLWSMCIGLRGIILHQIHDFRNDALAGVKTLPHRISRDNLKKFILWFSFPLEMLSLLMISFLMALIAPLSLIALGVYLLLEIAKTHLDWKMTCFHPEKKDTENYIPFFNNQFYETWWPLSFALHFLFTGLAGGIQVFLIIVLFFNSLSVNFKMNQTLCLDLWRRLLIFLSELSTKKK